MTNEHKFTPGPWKFDNVAGCRPIKGGKRGTHKQAQYRTFASTYGLYDDKEDEANARLIAAAPELLEALEYIVTGVVSPEGRRRAEAAIANATVSQDAARATGERA
jgi:hypothetical protein